MLWKNIKHIIISPPPHVFIWDKVKIPETKLYFPSNSNHLLTSASIKDSFTCISQAQEILQQKINYSMNYIGHVPNNLLTSKHLVCQSTWRDTIYLLQQENGHFLVVLKNLKCQCNFCINTNFFIIENTGQASCIHPQQNANILFCSGSSEKN